CNGPLTNEILPGMLQKKGVDPQQKLDELAKFLDDVFHVNSTSKPEDYPGLPLMMSLLDLALDRKQPFHANWSTDQLAKVRQAMELGIFDLLERQLNTAPTTNHYSMIHQLYPQPTEPCVLSLNYDLIIDTAMMFVSEGRGDMQGRFPDYGCDIQNDFYKEDPKRFGKLLKLHGSLNWLYCKACHRLEIGASEARKYLKILQKIVSLDLENSYTMQGQACQNCKGEMRPLLVAPTHLKDYRNPHLTQIWYRAEQVLRKADRVVFIGYSLPDDDLEVVYLLKRSLGHLTPQQITVVEYAPPTPATATTPAIPSPKLNEHAVGRRYRALFGDVDWHPEGLDSWLNAQQQSVAASAS
ncbi:MAG TPA: hypothetical protein VJW55_11005, partial [Candidatus Angelobacter sp.]|nr:hypothetical protein [Candidatus Angelobacter sp.]